MHLHTEQGCKVISVLWIDNQDALTDPANDCFHQHNVDRPRYIKLTRLDDMQ